MLVIMAVLGVYCLGLVSGVVCICIVNAGIGTGDEKYEIYKKTDIGDGWTGEGEK